MKCGARPLRMRPKLFASIGDYQNRQDWRTNWRTTCYLKCSDKALYFAGPCVGKLLAVSATDGEILWEHPYSNFQLILRDDALYGLSGQIDKHPSMKFDLLTGKVLAEVAKPRRACTRPTGSADAIFFRAEDGSVRLDLASLRPQWISPMRPVCQEGVTVANGLLYWWPSVCDCQLTLYGITCLGPAGRFRFHPRGRRIRTPREERRLGGEASPVYRSQPAIGPRSGRTTPAVPPRRRTSRRSPSCSGSSIRRRPPRRACRA